MWKDYPVMRLTSTRRNMWHTIPAPHLHLNLAVGRDMPYEGITSSMTIAGGISLSLSQGRRLHYPTFGNTVIDSSALPKAYQRFLWIQGHSDG